MSSTQWRRALDAFALVWLAASVVLHQIPESTSWRPRIVGAATAFLASLDQELHGRVLFAFDNERQSAGRSTFPTSFVGRAGLNMGELNTTQHAAAIVLIASALSRRGLESSPIGQ